MDERGAPDAGLCGACGLCCDGSLFSHGALAREEEPAAHRNSLRVFEERGELCIRLPCPAHRGDHCSVYAERPRMCADYRCMLLHRYEAGEIARDEALGRIAEVRRFVTTLRKLVDDEGCASKMDIWSAIEAHTQADGGAPPDDTVAWRRANQALLLEAAVLRAYVRRHFHAGAGKPSSSSSDDAPADGS